MAKPSEFTRALANLDAQIEKLQAVRDALIEARNQIPKRNTSKRPKAVKEAKEPAA